MIAARKVAYALRDDKDVFVNEIKDDIFIIAGRVEVRDLGAGLMEVTNLHNLHSVTTRSVEGAVSRAVSYLNDNTSVDLRDEHDQDAPPSKVLDDSHLRNK